MSALQSPSRDPQVDTPCHLELSALIIGIDDYQYVTHLSGAVNDAKAVKKFVEEKLGAQGRVEMLLNDQAKRIDIIRSLKSLAHPVAEEDKGRPILIFYAGHGGENAPPKGWEAGGPTQKVQNIIAWDTKVEVDGPNSEKITFEDNNYPIPDRTLGALIDQIAEARGNNITVIFDCCHSGSGTRHARSGNVRMVNVTIQIPHTLDQDIWAPHSRGGEVPDFFRRQGMRSHVLLAACNQEQVAMERKLDNKHRGVFTSALLTALEAELPHLSNVTYRELIKKIQRLDDQQDPQCEGFNQDRVIFRNNPPLRVYPRFPVRMENDSIVMENGAALVSRDSLYSVYDAAPKSEVLGVLAAAKVSSSRTIMRYFRERFPIKEGAMAVQKHAIEDSLHVYASEHLSGIMSEVIKSIQPHQRSLVMTPLEAADMVISATEPDTVVFHFTDERIKSAGLACMQIPVKQTVQDLGLALQSAAHFMHFLNEEVPIKPELDGKVTMHVRRALEVIRRRRYSPIGEDLCSHDMQVDVDVNQQNLYILEIFNNSEYDLYAYCLLFNPSNLSIEMLYGSPSSNSKPYPSLKRKQTEGPGSLIIGAGAAAGAPLQFRLNDKDTFDVSFLKLFVSTHPEDHLSSIEQVAVNKMSHSSTTEDWSASRYVAWSPLRTLGEVHIRHSIIITVRQFNQKSPGL
ncbi:hypothetical protein GYMLUDRAFT_72462 [Collybiopsis luxurians FD-317 M1]|uniref:Peptidase C14 caspase domain-containing protein n=1 Tax=Collybiopsis luxurians FD-317 M1 TaxID=944289 RepID=A0A0D0D0V8_9AGAR|nr:hypothetical protein GYMLUDRAFT_72462 [Collybiopsis luxurians FD-317 M1]